MELSCKLVNVHFVLDGNETTIKSVFSAGNKSVAKKTALITGATGFVGSHVLAVLMASGDHHLIATCRDPSRLPAQYQGEIK
ncbi:MAG TPA: NAD-dependent epimerase/dehydratase family protein [Rhodospirillales bacterium]|nr:NAD-dependent epimerase/dehydratase family protein [Rhodospirillales bacterium]